MTRVLVVDDSAFMRHCIGRALSAQPDLEVVGTASDGIEALELVRRLQPDVVTLDVEMPRLDGLRTLEILMRDMPRPVVMLSSLTEAGAPATIRALELGAVDFVTKPAPPAVGVRQVEPRLVAAVRAAAQARVPGTPAPTPGRPSPPPPLPRAGERWPKAGVRASEGRVAEGRREGSPGSAHARADQAVAIGCSTGGPRALLEVIPRLPADLPAAVLVVQHMPAGFTRSLAERLDQVSALPVKEAQQGDLAVPGLVLLAPGGRHMVVDPGGRVRLTDEPPVHGVRPSVDVLLRSLPPVFGERCVAVILTGMGCDGTDGAAGVRAAGGRVLAEDASTATVYGMPRAVAERGLAHRQAPLPAMADAIQEVLACL
jgi:two-component system chemotaxis response regulator CheB